MIEGIIDENLEARIELRVSTDEGHQVVKFLVDTGFNGFAAIPMSLVRKLNLTLGAVQSGVTADGRAGYFDTVSINLLWYGVPLSVRAQVLDEPLIGTRLLSGSSLSAQWVAGGLFQVSPLET